jgi:hypothetical protein
MTQFVGDVEQEIDRLFGLALAEFTVARNDLVRQLKAANDADAAARIQALPKPSVPAWAINQLSRRESGAVRELLDAGDTLRKAQRRLLERGGSVDSLREAMAKERESVRVLTERARAVLEGADRAATPAMLDRIRRTLEAAAVEEEGRRLLETGRLTGELEPAGFEAFAGLQATATERPALDELAERRRQREEAQQRKRELRQRVRDLEQEARAAEREADRATKAAEDARRAAESARAAADEAAAALDVPQ